jgi:hypothetical protein
MGQIYARDYSNGGRPNKGPRKGFFVRTTDAVGEKVKEESAETGRSYTDIIAGIVAAHYGLPAENPSDRHPSYGDQAILRLVT